MIKPSVLHVIAGAPRGGAETFCLDAILALHEAGVRQHVICRPHDHFTGTLAWHGIPFGTMEFSRLDWSRRGQALIRKTIKDFGPDLIHAWMGRAASFMPKNTAVPVLGWFGGYYDLKRYRSCDFYMGVTRDIVSHIIRKSGKPHRTFLVHTFGTLKPEPPANRTLLLTPPDAPVVLMLSRMHEKKGVDTLLQAATRLPNVYFWIAGDGPDLSTYELMAHDMGLGYRVRFLGWRSDRAALLQAATVCAMPSRYEPFGTVMAEAWHIGTPLVATRADGARQYIEDGHNGLLCAIDNAEELANKLNIALTDQTVRQTLIAGGRATYEKSFSKPVVLRALLEAYNTIVKTGKRKMVISLRGDMQAYDPAALVATSHQVEPDRSGDCAGVPEDTARLQSQKLYDFLRLDRSGRPVACEIWTPRECDQALKYYFNEKNAA